MATSFRSVPDMWHHRVGSTPDALALRYRVRGAWDAATWAQLASRVRALTNALLKLGIRTEERCAIVAQTSADWILVDLAILCAGGATTTAHPDTAEADVLHILTHSEAQVLFVDTWERAEHLLAVRSQLPALRRIIVFEDLDALRTDAMCVDLRRFEREGRDHGAIRPDAYARSVANIEPEQMATLMYTSGTTGTPRGIALSHRAWVYETEAVDALGLMSPADVYFLALPLSHVFSKVLQLANIRLGIPTVVQPPRSRDGYRALVASLAATSPTWTAVVPRTLERLRDLIDEDLRSRSKANHTLFRWAMLARARRANSPAAKWLAFGADRWVLSRVRQRLGGKLRFVVCGGAPLPREIAEYFDALGLPILEGYGLTESGGASCVNRLDDIRLGTVGPPLPGCKVRISAEGEIRLRSPGLMTEVFRDALATREAFDEDGYLRTGDHGRQLPEGHVQIMGRIKDIIVTSTGKNVAPQRFEERLRMQCPFVEHVLVHGDGQPACTALVTLDHQAIRQWAHDELLAFADMTDLATHDRVHRLIQTYVDDVNRDLAPFERVMQFAVLPIRFSHGNGLLTTTDKVRRSAVRERYADVLTSLSDDTFSSGPQVFNLH